MSDSDLAYISATLRGALAMLPQQECEQALDCFEFWCNEMRRIASSDPARVAHSIHCVIDERMQLMRAKGEHGRKVTCRKGCASCCYLSVDISPQEAHLLRMAAAEAGVEIDEARLARQAAHAGSWEELAPEDRRCVFLGEDRTCRVYEHRPGACRKYTVMNDPDLCDTFKYPGGEATVVFSLEAEIVQSAAMTVYGGANMAAMLLATRENSMTSNELLDIREEPGWIGGFTRQQAEGAIPNGTPIVKVKCEDADAHPLGAKGVVLGSIRVLPPLGASLFYFVEWECRPRVAVGCVDWKVAPL